MGGSRSLLTGSPEVGVLAPSRCPRIREHCIRASRRDGTSPLVGDPLCASPLRGSPSLLQCPSPCPRSLWEARRLASQPGSDGRARPVREALSKCVVSVSVDSWSGTPGAQTAWSLPLGNRGVRGERRLSCVRLPAGTPAPPHSRPPHI